MPFSFRFTWKQLICLIALGFSLAFPLSVSAEPILWTYKSTFFTDNGATMIDLGPMTIVDYHHGEYRHMGQFTYTPGRGVTRLPSGYEADSRQSFDSLSPEGFTILTVPIGFHRIRDGYDGITTAPDFPLSPNPFRMQLEITDSASQEKKILEFTGGLDGGSTYYTWPALEETGDWWNWMSWWLEPSSPTPQTFVLGENQYTFLGFSTPNHDEGVMWADIMMRPLVQTPEPSTLILAGLGFSAFAFRKRRPPELV